MTESSHTSPQVSGTEYSPLDALITKALRRYGDFAPETAEGDVTLMFIDFANEIIEELRQHPYWDTTKQLNYYVSQTETRDIPDVIMIAGLLAKYATQQLSQKAQALVPAYFRTMNLVLYNRMVGNGPIEMTVVDGGSNPRYQ